MVHNLLCSVIVVVFLVLRVSSMSFCFHSVSNLSSVNKVIFLVSYNVVSSAVFIKTRYSDLVQLALSFRAGLYMAL